MPGFYATVARFYDAEHVDKTDDLELYSALAAEYGGPILDVGCGTGRVMLHLAQAGYETHGIESEAAMLERAEARLHALPHLRDKVIFHQGNVLSYDFGRRYRLALLTYNALMHFHEQETQLALLRRLRDCTHEDGLLVIDLPNAGETFASQDTEALIMERTFIEPESGHLVMQQSVSVLDRVEQMLRVTWIYDEITGDGTVRRTFAPHLLRYFFFPELKLLLRQSGFEIEAVYGDVDYAPFEDGCERMVVFARPL